MTTRVVAVVSDSADPAADSLAHQYASLIEDLAGLPTRAIDTSLRDLPAATGAIFLPRSSHESACETRALARGVPVVTDHDTTAIALTAALLTTLTRAGRAPRASQVVIAGADTMPILCPLVMISDIGAITTWNPTDALTFPLPRITADVDAVINLLGDTPGTGLFTRDLEPAVITPDNDRDPLLALPGLLHAVLRTPKPGLDVNVHHACVLALVMATPPDQLLPHGPDQALTHLVADAAFQALDQTARHRTDTSSG